MAVPKTAEEFEALIAGLDVTTEAGRALFDVLSLTATGFKQVADAATAARTGLDGAIGSRNTQYARNTTLSQRNDIAQQFADALGVGFGEDLLSRMALSPESFEGLSTASMNLLTRFLGLQTSLEQLDDRLNETGRVITDVYLPVWQSPHERAEEERVRRHQEELDAAARRRDLGRPIAEYLIGSQQSNYSPLTPRQQLEAARQAYNANQALASSGDEYAMGRWSQLREALLAIGQRVNGSGSAEQVELFRSTYEQGRLLSGGQAPPLTITAFNTGNQQVVSAITTAEAQRQVDARSAQELMEQLIASLIDAQRETREATAEAIAVQERMRAEMRKANSKS